MRRLAAIDRVLLAITVPIWLAAFTSGVVSAARGWANPLVALGNAPSSSAYPRVIGVEPQFRGETVLRPGDEILRVGPYDLRGASALEYHTAAGTLRPDELETVYRRDGRRGETILPATNRRWTMAAMLPVSLAYAALGILGMLHARPTSYVRRGYLATMCVALMTTANFAGSRPAVYASAVLMGVTFALVNPLALSLLVRFNDEEPGPLARFGPWLLLPLGVIPPSVFYGAPFVLPPGPGFALFQAALLFPWAIFLVVAGRVYHRADPIARRQLRWILLGLYVTGLVVGTAAVFALLEPRSTELTLLVQPVGIVLPLAIAIAVTRYNLYDVDRLLSSTVSYNALLVVFVAGVLLIVPRLANALAGWLDVDPAAGNLGLTLVFAAALVSLQRRLRPRVEGIFFRERRKIEHGMAELLARLARCADTEAVVRELGEGLDGLLRPESCSIHVEHGDGFAPVFMLPREGSPPFTPSDSLLARLTRDPEPVLLSERGRAVTAPLTTTDRAAFGDGVEVLLPIRRADRLFAVVLLGRKRSGDVFTRTDLALLGSAGREASAALVRFDEAETLARAHAMQDRLRKWVPGAVAERLDDADDVEPGEYEVSVLFIDVRTDDVHLDGRATAEIFDTINRYTETVSAAATRHGGTVVEFSGRGMMVVFGGASELEGKERAAVEAAREIVATLASFGDAPGRAARGWIGVGVATGRAFLGPVRSADRLIWSAVGETTSLASRLQALTRELDAEVVIDAATWERCGALAVDFEYRSDVAVTGREETFDLYVLPFGSNDDDTGDLPARTDWTGKILAGRYRIDAVLGSGGMAIVYDATDRRLERRVVIKVPHAELLLRAGFRERFAREVRSLIRLEHPHVVRIHDAGQHDGVPYAVVQHLEGGDLRQRLDRAHAPHEPSDVLPWLRQIASALDSIHASGYVHRDVKPDNVLFDRDGNAFLSDLGITAALGQADAAPPAAPPLAAPKPPTAMPPERLTQPGLLLGAASYVAPEAIDRTFTPAYDQYGLAVIVYEALSQHLPYGDRGGSELLLAKATEPPTPLLDHLGSGHAPLCRVVQRALDREPSARFASCDAFARAFAEALDG